MPWQHSSNPYGIRDSATLILSSPWADFSAWSQSRMRTQFKGIRIKAREEFDWLIQHLTHEAYRARTNWDAWAAIEKAWDDCSAEIRQTPVFWNLTLQAHRDSVVLRLGRLYDPHEIAASLGNLLQTIRENAVCPSIVFPPSLQPWTRQTLIAKSLRSRRPTQSSRNCFRYETSTSPIEARNTSRAERSILCHRWIGMKSPR